MRVLITGGAGFIGSWVTRHFVNLGHEVCVADRFTYAGKGRNLATVLDKIHLLIGDLSTGDLADRCAAWMPDWVVHMAAETHVDRAIDAPEAFIRSNVIGTTRLLQAIYNEAESDCDTSKIQTNPNWWGNRKIIIYSTDEVFGSTPQGERFTEDAPYNPSNAYSASKVGVEAIANSFYVTHRMPVCIVRPCNTYGPGQHPEKVIPKFVDQMLRGEPVTIYNDGRGARDWLHVTDHARAIETILKRGVAGESYNLAAGEEHTDFEIFSLIEEALGDRIDCQNTFQYTPGRPGHDRRYWMDNSKLCALGWAPQVPFDEGFRDTVIWNAENQDWWAHDLVSIGTNHV